MSTDKVIDKIQKLLRLSKSSNEHEAANAAARAAEMMREHQLSEAQIRVTDETKTAEPITKECIHEARRAQTWVGRVGSALARSLGARMYWTGGNVNIFGRATAVATANYMLQYLMREVDRLADEAWNRARREPVYNYNPPHGKAWKNSFRMGAADTIANRLYQQKEEQKAREAREYEYVGNHSTVISSVSRALVLLKRDEQEVITRYEEMSKGWGKKATQTRISSYDGYSMGRTAGQGVSLNQGSRSLPSPASRLRGKE